ncbi:MAG TPA: LacI family DNA-binding transcriptional regulator [Humibacter sp.]|jgi:LacI family transcriptional regulator|nr:LacI family DNA-binding transcriptional regulator [Humibacter sp.]
MGKPPATARRAGSTITDVAARAQVSLSTVSRVMNGSTSVDPALAERVREAALSLGYSASPLARSLVLGKTQTLAVVVPDLGNPTFQGALRGLSEGASRESYHVLIADSHEQIDEERVLAIEARRRCDGIVLCAPRMPDDELAELLPLLAPVVLINRDPSSSAAASVAADYRSGLTQLLQHLHSLGHHELLYLAGNEKAASNRDRLSAIADFQATHDETRIEVAPCGVGFAEGYAAAETVVASRTTAVLAFNDLVAMGLLSALTERGIRVPEDVSVAGFDDIPFARYTTPPLTTATVPVEELGQQAWQRIWALLNGRAPAYNLSFGPLVVPRGSTGPAPHRPA